MTRIGVGRVAEKAVTAMEECTNKRHISAKPTARAQILGRLLPDREDDGLHRRQPIFIGQLRLASHSLPDHARAEIISRPPRFMPARPP
jgi:hypothetical protein